MEEETKGRDGGREGEGRGVRGGGSNKGGRERARESSTSPPLLPRLQRKKNTASLEAADLSSVSARRAGQRVLPPYMARRTSTPLADPPR